MAAHPQGYESETSSGYGSPTTPSSPSTSNQSGYENSAVEVSAYPVNAGATGYQSTSGSYYQSTSAPSYKTNAFSGYLSGAGSGVQSAYKSASGAPYQSTPPSTQYSKVSQSGYQSGGAGPYPSAPAAPSYLQNAQSGYQVPLSQSYSPQGGQVNYQFGGSYQSGDAPSYQSSAAPSYQSTSAAPASTQTSKSSYLIQQSSSPYKSTAAPSYQSTASPLQYQQQSASQSLYGQRPRPKPVVPAVVYPKSEYEASKAPVGSPAVSTDAYKPALNGYNAFAPGNVAGPIEVIPILSQSNQPNLGDGFYSYR